MTKNIGLLILALGLVSCGGSDGGGVANKGITSLWTLDDGTFSFDISAATLPIVNASFPISYSTGEMCTCTANMSGSETTGQYSLSSCIYSGGGSGNPGCAAYNHSGTFTATGVNMSMCALGGGCNIYR